MTPPGGLWKDLLQPSREPCENKPPPAPAPALPSRRLPQRVPSAGNPEEPPPPVCAAAAAAVET